MGLDRDRDVPKHVSPIPESDTLSGNPIKRITTQIQAKLSGGSQRQEKGLDRGVWQKGSLGLVIVSVQETQLDDIATLRIFALLDDVMQLLAEELQLPTTARSPLACASEVTDVFPG